MLVYYKNRNQSAEKGLLSEPVDELTLADVNGAVKGRFNSLCVAIGIRTLMQLTEQDAENLAGPKGKHARDRTASRHGYQLFPWEINV